MKAEILEKKLSFPQLWDSTQDNPGERRKLVRAEWDFFEENFIKPQYFQVLDDFDGILKDCGGSLSEIRKEGLFFDDKNTFKTLCNLSFKNLMEEVKIYAKFALQDVILFKKRSSREVREVLKGFEKC